MTRTHRARLCALLLSTTAVCSTAFADGTTTTETAGVEKIVVTAKKAVKGATKTDTPIKEVPQSIQVIPDTVIKDQGNLTVSETIRNVSSVQSVNPLQTPAYESTAIRGFGAEQWLDGLPSLYNGGDRDSLANAERIEVLKGPNAILYGGGSGAPLGGVVNVVSKIPQQEKFAQIGTTYGSYEYLQPSFDVNLPVTSDGTVLFRITGDYTSARSFIDVLETDRYAVNPTLLVTNNNGTTLTIQGRLSDWQQQEYQGLPATGTITGPFKLDRSLFAGPTDVPKSESRIESLTAKLDQKFDDVWSGSLQARLSHTKFEELVQDFSAGFDFAGNAPVIGSLWNVINVDLFQEQNEFSLNGNIIAQFNAAGAENTFLFGADYARISDKGAMLGDFNDLFLLGPVDLTAPVFPAFVKPANNPFNTIADGDNLYTTSGVYAQLQSNFRGRVHLLGGLRLANLQVDNVSPATGFSGKLDETRVLPRVGAVVDVTPEISLFADYSEGMKGNTFVFFLGAPAPELSDQTEAGIKFDFAFGLSGSAAIFEINRSGVPVGFPAVANGEQRSRGFDADLTWQASDNWFVLANYAHIDAEYLNASGGGSPGNQLNIIPPDSGRVWVSYRFTTPGYRGLSAGAGVYAASSAYVDPANVYETSGYYTVDAKVGFDDEDFSASLSVKNLTDREYFVPFNYFGGRIAPGEPLSVYSTFAVKIH